METPRVQQSLEQRSEPPGGSGWTSPRTRGFGDGELEVVLPDPARHHDGRCAAAADRPTRFRSEAVGEAAPWELAS
ncbi:hypothetical protein ACFYRC_30260 [Streptomyces sp. NPDC005279]|uniref:hypothetical protein n=1 Tax=Streptomyces sp. NPDC005279 TaxID=3364712 RepID=UPI003674A99F